MKVMGPGFTLPGIPGSRPSRGGRGPSEGLPKQFAEQLIKALMFENNFRNCSYSALGICVMGDSPEYPEG